MAEKALIILCDVAYADQVEAAAEQTEKEFGPIDVWVNNASNSLFGPFKEITAEEFKEFGFQLPRLLRRDIKCNCFLWALAQHSSAFVRSWAKAQRG